MSTYDDASLIMFPSGYKEDKIYSLKPTDGSGDLTFTRASTATRVNADGLIETSPVNLLTYSEEFDNAAWTKNELTITANNATSPNGIQNADTALETTTNAYHDILNTSTSLTLNTNYTLSCFVKYAGREYIYLFISDGIAAAAIKFNVQTGVVLGTALGTVVSSKIENFGNGWYRCSMVYAASVSVTGTIAISTTNSPALSLAPYAGDVTKGISVWGAQLNIGATAKPYFPTTDRLNVPRIDYTGGGCGKLLLEPQRTNLVTYSSEFDNAAWTKSDSTVTANATTSPDGTINADKLIANTTSAAHLIQQTFTPLSATSYTLSTYAKAGEYNFIGLQIAFGGINAYASFNLSTGVITLSGGGATATIQNAGNGWYRCFITATTISAAESVFNVRIENDGSLSDFVGNNVDGIYAYGAQLEQASYATSYIPTLASSVTRLADSASKTGISSLIGQTEGTLFVDIDLTHSTTGANSYLMQIYKDSGLRILIYRDGASGGLSYYFLQAATIFNYISSISSNARHKLAFAYKSGDSVFYIDGAQVDTDATTFSAFSSLNELHIGANFNPTQAEIGDYSYNQAILFPTRLTNAELATLTTI